MTGDSITVGTLGETSPDASFHVFSINPPDLKNQIRQYTREYVSRKTHRKSKSGCSACKSRRVKCGEERPICLRCIRSKAECKYESSPPESDGHGHVQKPGSACQDSSSDAIERIMSSLMVLPRQTLISSTSDLYLLKHWDTLTSNALLIGPEPAKYHDGVLSLAQSHAYLFHAMLSIAALHLHETQVRGYKQAKLAHLSVALQQFQKTISKPIRQEDADAVILTAMMVNVQYFTWIDSSNPQESWVFSSDPLRLAWLSVQQGLGAILAHTRKYNAQSQLLPYFYVRAIDGDRRLPQGFFDLCDVKDVMGLPGEHPNPYHDALWALALLMPYKPGIDSLIKYLHFCGRMYPPFVALVGKNDHRALLILSWWFTLLDGVGEMWWCSRRVRRDCYAICMLLDGEASEDVKALLESPAASCGYRMAYSEGTGSTADD